MKVTLLWLWRTNLRIVQKVNILLFIGMLFTSAFVSLSTIFNRSNSDNLMVVWWYSWLASIGAMVYCKICEQCDRWMCRGNQEDATDYDFPLMLKSTNPDVLASVVGTELASILTEQCFRCQMLHGEPVNGKIFVCAIHPEGKANCPDFEAQQ